MLAAGAVRAQPRWIVRAEDIKKVSKRYHITFSFFRRRYSARPSTISRYGARRYRHAFAVNLGYQLLLPDLRCRPPLLPFQVANAIWQRCGDVVPAPALRQGDEGRSSLLVCFRPLAPAACAQRKRSSCPKTSGYEGARTSHHRPDGHCCSAAPTCSRHGARSARHSHRARCCRCRHLLVRSACSASTRS